MTFVEATGLAPSKGQMDTGHAGDSNCKHAGWWVISIHKYGHALVNSGMIKNKSSFIWFAKILSTSVSKIGWMKIFLLTNAAKNVSVVWILHSAACGGCWCNMLSRGISNNCASAPGCTDGRHVLPHHGGCLVSQSSCWEVQYDSAGGAKLWKRFLFWS